MKKIVFISSVFAFGFKLGYWTHSNITVEVLAQTLKRSVGDYSYDKKSVGSRIAKSILDENEVKEFSESLDKLR